MFAKIARTCLLSKLVRQTLSANCEITWGMRSYDGSPYGVGNFARVVEPASILMNWVMQSTQEERLVRRVQLFEVKHKGAVVLVLVDSIEDWRTTRSAWARLVGTARSPRFNANVTIVAAPRRTSGLYERMTKDARQRAIVNLESHRWNAVEKAERLSIAGITGAEAGDKEQHGLTTNCGVFLSNAMAGAGGALH